MKKITCTILILSVIVGLSMCEDESQNYNKVSTDPQFNKDFSDIMDSVIRQFEDLQTLNGELEGKLVEVVSGESEDDLGIIANKFLQILKLKQESANTQIETLEGYQLLASHFISAHTN